MLDTSFLSAWFVSKDKKSNIVSHKDNDKNTLLYDGPLVILINAYSASAAEIRTVSADSPTFLGKAGS